MKVLALGLLILVVMLISAPAALAAPGCPADTNYDGQVTVADVLATAGAWGSSSGQPAYQPRYDLNFDGVVDVIDVQATSAGFGTTCSAPPVSALCSLGVTTIAENDHSRDHQNLLIDGCQVTINGYHVFYGLDLRNGGRVTHASATSGQTYVLDLELATATISSNSTLDVSSRGYLGGYQGDNASLSGRTFGNTTTNGATERYGGGHAGLGSRSNVTSGSTNPTYGDLFAPFTLGSGGAANAANTPGGSGGGALRLVVLNTLSLAGTIAADGGSVGGGGGGGAGGSINLDVGTLSGSGAIYARGGAGGNIFQGGGGGGRIALTYTALSGGFDLTHLSAKGASGFSGGGGGGAGTVLVRQRAASQAALIIDNGGQDTAADSTPLYLEYSSLSLESLKVANKAKVRGPATLNLNTLIVDNATLVAQTITLGGTFQINNGGVLSHPNASSDTVYSLSLTAPNGTIAAGGALDVTGKGYLGGLQAGNPDATGRTLGNTTAGGSMGGAGGSYGGLGGRSNSGGTPNAVYGSTTAPDLPGSGGSGIAPSALGGSGGGSMRLIISGGLTLNGALRANGGAPTNAAGGSGGSIWLTTGTLSGNGALEAKGSNPGGFTGAGGGGRIAIYGNRSAFSGTTSAAGGTGFNSNNNGQAGTVYLP